MAEFDFSRAAPLGIPGNPLDGTPGLAQDAYRRRKEPGTKQPLTVPGKLEHDGITDVGGVPGAMQLPQFPEQLAVPDPVSATDPAFSMHPVVRALSASNTPASDYGNMTPAPPAGSAMMQMLLRGKPARAQLDTRNIFSGLGLNAPYGSQGMDTIT